MGIYPPQVPEDTVLPASGHISGLQVCMCGKVYFSKLVENNKDMFFISLV